MNSLKSFVSLCRNNAGICLMGLVSLFISFSSTIFFAVSAFYMNTVLHISVGNMALIEQATDATAQLGRLVSGMVCDMMKKYKPMLVLGTVLVSLARITFLFATTPFGVVVSKIFDRIGNGVATTPRDGYVAVNAPKKSMGFFMSFSMTLKLLGCVLGPFLASFMLWCGAELITVLYVAALPSIFAVFIATFWVKDSKPTKEFQERKFELRKIGSLPLRFWAILCVMAVFTFAKMPESTLVMRLNAIGMPMWFCTSVIAVFNTISVLSSIPIGRLSDRVAREFVMLIPFCALVLSLYFLSTDSKLACVMAVFLWGIQRSASQLLAVSVVADCAKKEIVGTAIGMLNVVSSVVTILGGMFYQHIIDTSSLPFGFFCGSMMSLFGTFLMGLYCFFIATNRRKILQEQ